MHEGFTNLVDEIIYALVPAPGVADNRRTNGDIAALIGNAARAFTGGFIGRTRRAAAVDVLV